MQVLLSADDQQLLKSLRRAANLQVYLGIGVGIVLTVISCGAVGLMISEGYFSGMELLLAVFMIFFCGGMFLLYKGFSIGRKIKQQFDPILYKRIVTGKLQQLEVIDKKHLRYTINGASFLVYVPLPIYLEKPEYKRPLVSAAAFVNTEVALHLVVIEPGIELLLQSHYNQSVYQTTVLPLDKDDKQQQLRNFKSESGIIFGIFAFIGFIIAMFAGFRMEGWYVLALMLVVFLIVVCGFSLPRLISILKGTRKICITTTVTEKIEAMARSGKRMSKHTWYRFGNGTVELHQLPFNPGDTVLIQHLKKKNGNKGTLLDIRRIYV